MAKVIPFPSSIYRALQSFRPVGECTTIIFPRPYCFFCEMGDNPDAKDLHWSGSGLVAYPCGKFHDANSTEERFR